MATQENAPTLFGVIGQAKAAIVGLDRHGEEVGAQDMKAVLEERLAAVHQKLDQASLGEANLATAQTRSNDAFKALTLVVATVLSFLKLSLGKMWNPKWAVLNMPGNSLAVPQKKVVLMEVARTMQGYLAADPARESAAFGITAANLAAAMTAAETAAGNLQDAKEFYRSALDARDFAEKLLRQGLSAVRIRLKALGREDNRWYWFGYSRPCDPETPEVPVDLVVVPQAAGACAVRWTEAHRAERYRVYVKEEGTPAEAAVSPKLSTTETEAKLEGLTAGRQYEVTVTAVNRAGESLQSTPVIVTAM